MNPTYPIRPIAMSELPQFIRVGEHAFNSTWPTEEFMAWERKAFEPERSLAAFDGDEIIGTTTIISFDMTVPGGDEVATAGVTSVAVLPSHRRRGVLSSLMDTQLADVSATAEPVAALFASEAPIYGRYGYGAASTHLSFDIKRGEGALKAPANPPVLRIVEPNAAIDSLKQVYDTVRKTRPGMLTRNQAYWDVFLADHAFLREGSTPTHCVVAEDDSGPRGYALYSAKPDWADGLPAQVLNVRDLFGTDRDATLALWADMLSRDLVGEVRTRSRPLDDPLLYQLADPRRARPSYGDGLWIRLVDLPAALTSRRYACEVDVVIDVTDERLPANSGTWRLQAGGLRDQGKPVCERTTAEADMALPVSALGAAYLGGTRLGGLAAAGQITELRPGAVASLSAAMWWDPAPWAPTNF